jgi:hypothetical protein
LDITTIPGLLKHLMVCMALKERGVDHFVAFNPGLAAERARVGRWSINSGSTHSFSLIFGVLATH